MFSFCMCLLSFLFFFHAPPTTEIYTLSLHDALPISPQPIAERVRDLERRAHGIVLEVDEHGDVHVARRPVDEVLRRRDRDRKSTRLNSSHRCISYAVFCLKKKKKKKKTNSI